MIFLSMYSQDPAFEQERLINQEENNCKDGVCNQPDQSESNQQPPQPSEEQTSAGSDQFMGQEVPRDDPYFW